MSKMKKLLSVLLIGVLLSGITLVAYAADHQHVYVDIGDEVVYNSYSGAQHPYTDNDGNLQTCQVVIFVSKQYFQCMYCSDDGYRDDYKEVHYGCGK